MKRIFKAKIEKGKVVFQDQMTFKLYLCTLEGKDVDVTVCKHVKTRSSNQNKYYWKIIVELVSQEIGMSKDETHEALRLHFLLDKSGKMPRVKSTTELTTSEMETYMSEIRGWASSFLNTYLPSPNEVDYE